MPAAEVEIDEELVAALLADQRPDLSGEPIEFLANGWDNTSFRIGTKLVARLPRRAMAVDLVANEAKWLPELAQRLPLPIPAPTFLGEPAAGYPWPWTLTPYLHGESAALSNDLDLRACGVQIGGFLRALHAPAPSAAPDNPYRGGPLEGRHEATRARLKDLSGEVRASSLERVWRRALRAAEHSGPLVWVHGDLHPHNLLVASHRLSAVVDFGDLTAGDPATDLAIGWSLLTAKTRPHFWEAYGAVDEHLQLRAMGWAVSLGTAYLAHSANNPTMAAIGRRTLDQVLGDVA